MATSGTGRTTGTDPRDTPGGDTPSAVRVGGLGDPRAKAVARAAREGTSPHAGRTRPVTVRWAGIVLVLTVCVALALATADLTRYYRTQGGGTSFPRDQFIGVAVLILLVLAGCGAAAYVGMRWARWVLPVLVVFYLPAALLVGDVWAWIAAAGVITATVLLFLPRSQPFYRRPSRA